MGPSDARRCLTAALINDCGQPPNHTRSLTLCPSCCLHAPQGTHATKKQTFLILYKCDRNQKTVRCIFECLKLHVFLDL